MEKADRIAHDPKYIGADLDITTFLVRVRERKPAFSFAMTYVVSTAMNEVEALRYRIQSEQVVLHERVHPAFSYLAPGDEYFKMVVTDLDGSMDDFATCAREKALRPERPDLHIQPPSGGLHPPT